MTPPRLIYPCPPYNTVTVNANGTRQDFYGPPSVAGQAQHNALDFPCPDNTKLLQPLVGGGLVTEVGTAGAPGYQATGNMIEVSADGFSVRMLHLRQSLVRVGQRVTQGEHIGYTDNTGLTTGPHLHMAVWADTKGLALQVQADPVQVYGRWAVDPERLLSAVEEDDMLFVIRAASNPGNLYILNPGRGKRQLDFATWKLVLENKPGVMLVDPIPDDGNPGFKDIPDDRFDKESWGMLRFFLGAGDNELVAQIVDACHGDPNVVAAEKANGAAQRKLTPWFHPQTGWEQGIEP